MLKSPVEEVYRLPDGTDLPKRTYDTGMTYVVSLGGSW